MDTAIILSICQIAAVALIPFLIWLAGNSYERRKSKLEAKRTLFYTLMKNRKSYYSTKEKVDALNLIDVVYQDEHKVRRAWKDYLEALNPNSPNFNNSNAYLLDLLSEMAQSLGYKELKQTEIDRFYEPQIHVNDRTTAERLTAEILRVLEHSKSFSEGRTEEEMNAAHGK